jgi:copper homeostasis protein
LLLRLLSYSAVQNKYLLEISVESVDAARAAERGGADRIELCSNLSVGGVTPADSLMLGTRANVKLPIFAMIRPRAGDFVYSGEDFAAMKKSIKFAKQLQVDGVVLGILTADSRIDVARTRELVALASPGPVTFHRAFDECADLRVALEDVIKTGATRLLTSGGKRTAPEALDLLGDLVRLACERLIVMPGSGLHAGNIREAVRKTGVREFHAGLSSVVTDPAAEIGKFEAEVRRMAESLRDCD